MPASNEDQHRLRRGVERQIKRADKARREHASLLAQTAYLGTLGLLLILPVVIGLYVGVWLDEMMSGYSIRWTMLMLALGLFVGCVNLYLYLRE